MTSLAELKVPAVQAYETYLIRVRLTCITRMRLQFRNNIRILLEITITYSSLTLFVKFIQGSPNPLDITSPLLQRRLLTIHNHECMLMMTELLPVILVMILAVLVELVGRAGLAEELRWGCCAIGAEVEGGGEGGEAGGTFHVNMFHSLRLREKWLRFNNRPLDAEGHPSEADTLDTV